MTNVATLTATALPATDQRLESLRDALLSTVDLLQRRRAGQVRDGLLNDYVEMNWLEWHGGSLRLTVTGTNVCRQMSNRIGR